MHRKAAKELLHIKGWLERVDEIIDRGKDAYHRAEPAASRSAYG